MMNSFGSVRDLMLYGGLTRRQFAMVNDDAIDDNLRHLMIYAPIGAVVFCVLVVASMLSVGVASQNIIVYAVFSVAMGIIALIAHFVGARSKVAVQVLVHLFMLALYGFAIIVSMMHAEYPAVSAIVFLLVTPLLFIERPIYVTLQICLAVFVICIATIAIKDAIIARDDIWNAVTFGIVGIVVNIFLMRTKFTALYQAHEISYLSEVDALTGLKNRNCYETRLEDYARGDATVIVCAYADADGLHELNNEKGHDAGDKLLCAIASEMQELFGEEHTYRIGGDEFVAFLPDGNEDDVRALLKEMRERLQGHGHRVSVGASSVARDRVDMHELVRNAEKEMYAQKFAIGGSKSRVG